VNAWLQAGRKQRAEQVIDHQLIRGIPSKMKNILEKLTERDGEGTETDTDGEGDGEHAERCRKQMHLTGQVGTILDS
jgi:hypothetical protein